MTLYRLLHRVDFQDDNLEILGDVDAGSPGAALRLVTNKTPGAYVAVPVTNWSELHAIEKHVAPQIIVADAETVAMPLDLGPAPRSGVAQVGPDTSEFDEPQGEESVESIAAAALDDEPVEDLRPPEEREEEDGA